MADFVKMYGEANYLLAHAVSGEMPMGMRLTLVRHAEDLAVAAQKEASGQSQDELAAALLAAVDRQRDLLNSEVTV